MVFQMVFQFFNGAEDFDLENLLYRTDCYNPRTKNKSIPQKILLDYQVVKTFRKRAFRKT